MLAPSLGTALPGVSAPAAAAPPQGRHRAMALAATVALALAVPFAVSGYELFLVVSIMVFAIALIGLNVLAGYAGLLSLGQGAIFAMGAYLAAFLAKGGAVPVVLIPAVAGLACMLFGRVFARGILRLEGMQFALATFGLAIVLPQLLRHDFLQRWTGGSQGITFTRPAAPTWTSLSEDQWLYALALAYLAATLFLVLRITRNRTGRAWLALKDNPLSASAMGVDVASFKRQGFELGALCAGISGALNALAVQFVAPDSFNFLLSITLFIGLVVGGIGSIAGPALGACFIVLVPNFAEEISQAATSAIYGGAVILLMGIEKKGLAGLLARLWRLATKLFSRSGASSRPPGTPDTQP